MEIVVSTLFNGMLYGLLLFMLSSGLTLIFSLMGVLNFAHASFYMLGAYAAYQIGMFTNFWIALFLAPLVIGAVGAAVERFGLRTVHPQGHVAELLLTFGLAYVIEEIVRMIWGKLPVAYRVPASLDFPLLTIAGVDYPAYRFFMVFIAVFMFFALYLLLTRTRIGLIVQAALTHPDMLRALGHNVPVIFMMVFAAGAALAALAGVIGGNYLVTEPGMATSLGTIIFVVVVLGGLGSLEGALIASLGIGIIQSTFVAIDQPFSKLLKTFGVDLSKKSTGLFHEIWSITPAQIGPLVPYLLLVLVLIVRPRGLFGTRN